MQEPETAESKTPPENHAMRRYSRFHARVMSFALLVGMTSAGRADIVVPGADGSDGRLTCGTFLTPPNPTYPCDIDTCSLTTPLTWTIDLSQAVPRAWDTPSPQPGRGVYDHEKWAVVFKYECVNIPPNVTIRFVNHPSRAPVVWLVSGNVNIRGTVIVDAGAAPSTPGSFTEPGPGGFRGGARGNSAESLPSAGLGPGGGSRTGFGNNGGWAAGSYATRGASGGGVLQSPEYGNSRIVPLIGGSGGAPWSDGAGGGGGGSILIASSKAIVLNKSPAVSANASNSASDVGGSGGAIRLIADQVLGFAGGEVLQARGGGSRSGTGRIRIESKVLQFAGVTNPAFSSEAPAPTAVLWPDVTAPFVQIKTIGAQVAPTDPRASLDIPGADVIVPNQGSQLVVLEAKNVPLDWAVAIRMVPRQGPDVTAQAAYISGNEALSTWHATLPLPPGFAVLQARAYEQSAAAFGEDDEEASSSVQE